jgi:hypothetical protein
MLMSPRSKKFMPRVITRELSFSLVTRIPLINPIAKPVRIAQRSPKKGYPVFVVIKENIQRVAPTVEGNDKSLSPQAEENTNPHAKIRGIGYTIKIAR